jgi:hypothetical protein
MHELFNLEVFQILGRVGFYRLVSKFVMPTLERSVPATGPIGINRLFIAALTVGVATEDAQLADSK